MSDPDNFLSRWSRRKLEPSKTSDNPAAPKTEPETEQSAESEVVSAEPETPVAAVPAQDQKQEPAFDPASLPPIESITAGTDIRDFLKPGVPLSLSRAALRRAWTSDPAIRDFIGIAENQWDFTNDSIPGFGPLDPADIPRLLAKIISSSKEGAEAVSALTEDQTEVPQSAAREPAVAEGNTDAPEKSKDDAPVPAEERLATNDASERDASHRNKEDASHRNKENDAMQNSETDRKLDYAQVRNGHGGALPN